ncbi:MAG: stage V sporulation protein AD [Ruminococcaceae bacterium]|nr:stage V sporulation protein AD [Oscillospiraceae bacterium]
MNPQAFKPQKRVFIIGQASVVGQQERMGPIGDAFDISEKDDFGMDTWEKAEAEMQRLALGCAMSKAGLREGDIDCMLAGDLINQCISSNFGLLDYNIPYLGLYGACSTCAEGMLLGSLLCGGGTGVTRCAAVTSSHYCSAERQFRFPLEYGGQRTPTAQWTVTGSGAFLLSSIPEDAFRNTGAFIPEIVECMPGCAVDRGISDVNNMGAAMAPSAVNTLKRYFESGHSPEEFDWIVTGDLGSEGSAILIDLMHAEGYNIQRNHRDCGKIIYNSEATDKHAGGSGCGCSAVVMAANILTNIMKGTVRDILFLGTGALMNPMSLNQKQSIPGIAHLVKITAAEKSEIEVGQ